MNPPQPDTCFVCGRTHTPTETTTRGCGPWCLEEHELADQYQREDHR